MVRVTCKICGAEILPAAAEGNEGLCGRCAKGNRPCIYCGGYVSEPLQGGIYAHVECWMRHRQGEENLGWKKVEDIDWVMTRKLLRSAATKLFQTVARERQDTSSVTLMLFVRVQDFIEITVHEVELDGSSRRLSDSQWDKDLSPLDSSFSIMYETLSDGESFDASERVSRSLTHILSDECNELAKANFYFPLHVQVSWSVKCD